MESETIETLLTKIGLERFIDVFQVNEVTLELLKELPEDDVKETLIELKLPLGVRKKIFHTIKKMETKNETQTQRKSPDDDKVNRFTSREKMKDLYESDIELETTEKKPTDLEKKTNKECFDDDIESSNTGKEAMEKLYKADTELKTAEKKDKVKELIGNFEKWTKQLRSGRSLLTQRSEMERKVRATFLGKNDGENEIRLVLLGKSGSGKSASGNTILGGSKTWFESVMALTGVTRHCSQNFVERFGKKIIVVDTPGVFDTYLSNEEVQQEIYKCIGITSPGPHAFILVLNLTVRFTEEEERSVQHFVQYFGKQAYKYFIVLFTRKDELDKHKKTTLNQYLETAPPELKRIIDECGGRIFAFNNNLKGKEQDDQAYGLIHMVEDNIRRNNGEFYSNEMYTKAEEEIKSFEAEKLREEKEQLEKEYLEKNAAKNYRKVKKEEEHFNRLIDQLKQMKTREDDKEYSKLLDAKNESERKIEAFIREQEEEKRKLQEKIQQDIEARANTIRNETRDAIAKRSWCSIS